MDRSSSSRHRYIKTNIAKYRNNILQCRFKYKSEITMTEKINSKENDLEKLDTYDYDFHKKFKSAKLIDRMKERISDFLCFCAGADTQILARCPHSERVKEQGIGGVVFATAALAFLSGSYAFYTVFSPKPGFATVNPDPIMWYQSFGAVLASIIFGIVWSLVIFNLDRFIVSSGGHGDGTDDIKGHEIIRALPRIFMAIVIGLVLSKPLEIRIMQSEIDAELRVLQNERLEKLNGDTRKKLSKDENEIRAQRDKIGSQIQEIDDQAKKYRTEASARADDVIREQSGQGGSGTAGVGKRAENADKLRVAAENKVKEFEESSKAEKELLKQKYETKLAELKELDKKRQIEEDKNAKDVANLDGLIMRIKVAHEISPLASYMLTALLMVLEIAPIFFKMMLTLGPYDYFNENQKRISLAVRGIHLREGLTHENAKELHVHDMVYEQAERAGRHEIGKLKIEQELTRVAQEKFEEITKSDIVSNPDKYLVNEKI